MRAGEKKALIWLAVVLLLWRVFELAHVEDLFLQFITVGALPGTDKTLSPDQVLILVAVLFSLSLLLIFRKELVRSFRVRSVAHQQVASADKEAGLKLRSIVIRRGHHGSIRIPMSQLQIRDKKLPELYLPSPMPTIWRIIDWEMKQFSRLYQLLSKTYRDLKPVVIKAGRRAMEYAIMAWGWLEPQLRAFDKWLERKASKNRISSDFIEILDDCWRTVRFYVRKWTN